jgi:hypothetical protein
MDGYRFAKHVLKASPQGLFRLQMTISQHELRRASPTKLLKQLLDDRQIPAVVKSSKVVDFYDKAFRNYEGITSSVLAYSEGNTLSCLSVLAKIEQEDLNAPVPNSRRPVFLYVDVNRRTITEALREALQIQEGENIYKVLMNLSKTKDGYLTIFGIIDQYDQWHPDDVGVLSALVIQSYRNYRLHVPTAIELVASKIEFNGGKKASYLGPVTESLRHDLSEAEAREYVNALTDDAKLAEEITQLVVQEMSKPGHVNPQRICEIYEEVLSHQ